MRLDAQICGYFERNFYKTKLSYNKIKHEVPRELLTKLTNKIILEVVTK